jgi:hypothetical protein
VLPEPLAGFLAAPRDDIRQHRLGGTTGDLHPTASLGSSLFPGHRVGVWLFVLRVHPQMVGRG